MRSLLVVLTMCVSLSAAASKSDYEYSCKTKLLSEFRSVNSKTLRACKKIKTITHLNVQICYLKNSIE
mgnify:CR=1 FL=1